MASAPPIYMEEQADPLRSTSSRLQEHGARYVFAAAYCDNKKVLDVACGLGYGTDYLRRQNAHVVGLDVDPLCIKTAKERYPETEYIVGSAEKLPLHWTEEFDVVVSFETIEHLRASDIFLAEIRRCLKPNGLLICSTLNKTLRVFRSANPYHMNEMRAIQFERMVNRHLSVIELHGQILYSSKDVPLNAIRTLGERIARALLLPPMGISTKLSESQSSRSPFLGTILTKELILPSFMPVPLPKGAIPEFVIVVAQKR